MSNTLTATPATNFTAIGKINAKLNALDLSIDGMTMGVIGAVETISTTPATLSPSTLISFITIASSAFTIALPAADDTTPPVNGQLKYIIMSANTGTTTLATIGSSQINGYTSVTMDAVGETVILMYDDINEKWSVISNDGATLVAL